MSVPINIFRHSKNIDDFNTPEYVYQLTVYMKNNTCKEFVKVSNSNSITLISYNDTLNYNMIKNFNLIITKVIINSENFVLDGEVGEKTIFKGNDIYLEFNKNKDNYTECYCTINSINKHRLFFTPPNY